MKMQQNDYHVVPFHGQWAIIEEGHENPVEVFEDMRDAWSTGDTYAMFFGTGIVIHDTDGRIIDSFSYRQGYK